jgi:hypothetical protein
MLNYAQTITEFRTWVFLHFHCLEKLELMFFYLYELNEL